MKKAFFIIVLLTLIGFAGWTAYQKYFHEGDKKEGSRRKAAVAVETAPVRQETVRDIGMFTGTLYPKTEYVVAPKISGRLKELTVDIGDRVEAGQTIAVLDDAEYVQQVDQAEAELEVARANLQECRVTLENAKREFERVKTLRKKKIASESELDSAESTYLAQEAKQKVALAQITQKKALLKAAEVRLSYTRIKADWKDPGDRYVGERFVYEGDMLAANESIVSIMDIGSLTAVVHVIERDYTKIRLGQSAVITTEVFPGEAFEGTIVRIAPLIKVKSRQSRVEIAVSNESATLKPGMFIRARIEYRIYENATVIPTEAVCSRNGQQGAFMADRKSMKVRFVPMDLGVVDGDLVQVIDPPIDGEVVTLGKHLLADGSNIFLPGTGESGRSSSEKDSPAEAGSKSRSGEQS